MPKYLEVLERLDNGDRIALVDPGSISTEFQPRCGVNINIVEEYAELTETTPPLVVFTKNDRVFDLADGRHRLEAAKKRGSECVKVRIKNGDRRAAMLYAVGANRTHGLRRNRADVRKCILVLLNDSEWGQRSDRWIAEQVGCSHPTVGSYRAELANLPTSELVNLSSSTIGKDGKQRPRKVRNPASDEGNGSEAKPERRSTLDDFYDVAADLRESVRRLFERCPQDRRAAFCGELRHLQHSLRDEVEHATDGTIIPMEASA